MQNYFNLDLKRKRQNIEKLKKQKQRIDNQRLFKKKVIVIQSFWKMVRVRIHHVQPLFKDLQKKLKDLKIIQPKYSHKQFSDIIIKAISKKPIFFQIIPFLRSQNFKKLSWIPTYYQILSYKPPKLQLQFKLVKQGIQLVTNNNSVIYPFIKFYVMHSQKKVNINSLIEKVEDQQVFRKRLDDIDSNRTIRALSWIKLQKYEKYELEKIAKKIVEAKQLPQQNLIFNLTFLIQSVRISKLYLQVRNYLREFFTKHYKNSMISKIQNLTQFQQEQNNKIYHNSKQYKQLVDCIYVSELKEQDIGFIMNDLITYQDMCFIANLTSYYSYILSLNPEKFNQKLLPLLPALTKYILELSQVPEAIQNNSQNISPMFNMFCQLYLIHIRKISDQQFIQLGVHNMERMIRFMVNIYFKLTSKYEIGKVRMIEILTEIYYKNQRNKWFDQKIFHLPFNQNNPLLSTLPFLFTFQSRYNYFRTFIQKDKTNYQLGLEEQFNENLILIRREKLFEDGFYQLKDKDIRKRWVVVFCRGGIKEEGIDGGGLFKQFLLKLTNEGFNPTQKLFTETDQHQLIPSTFFLKNTSSQIFSYHMSEEVKELYKFLGKITGKAIYENILIETQFNKLFINKILNRNNIMYDQEMKSVLEWQRSVGKEVDELGITFSLLEKRGQKVIQIQLIQGGKNIPVTKQNLSNYISLYWNYTLNQKIHVQSYYFIEGLSEVIPQKLLKMFNPKELQKIISGDKTNINLQDWKKHTIYHSYSEQDQTIISFWEVLQEIDQSQKRKLLFYVTSCSRPPLNVIKNEQGFSGLKPMFGIQRGLNCQKLPQSSTCTNLLILPDYKKKNILREKLLYSINSDSGYEIG